MNDWQAFNKYTVPKLQVRKVMKIQALFRGAYVRKKVIPSLRLYHLGSKAVADEFINDVLEVREKLDSRCGLFQISLSR